MVLSTTRRSFYGSSTLTVNNITVLTFTVCWQPKYYLQGIVNRGAQLLFDMTEFKNKSKTQVTKVVIICQHSSRAKMQEEKGTLLYGYTYPLHFASLTAVSSLPIFCFYMTPISNALRKQNGKQQSVSRCWITGYSGGDVTSPLDCHKEENCTWANFKQTSPFSVTRKNVTD